MKAKLFLAIAFLAPSLANLHAQSDAEKAVAVIKETEKFDNSTDNVSAVIWMPIEYWKLAVSGNPRITDDTKQDMVKTMQDYLVFAVIDVKKGGLAIFTPTDPDIIRNSATLTLPSGKKITPVGDDDLSPGAQNLIAMFKPVMGNLLGKMGQGITFLVFSNKDENGKKLVDSLDKGKMTISENGHTFTWRLPLGSLMPLKVCPECGEEFPGNYDFCPYDGTKLKEAPMPKPTPTPDSTPKSKESKPPE